MLNKSYLKKKRERDPSVSPTQYIDSFHKIFAVNIDYFPKQCSALGLRKGDGLCSL